MGFVTSDVELPRCVARGLTDAELHFETVMSPVFSMLFLYATLPDFPRDKLCGLNSEIIFAEIRNTFRLFLWGYEFSLHSATKREILNLLNLSVIYL